MDTVSTSKVLIAAAGVLFALGSVAGCSGSNDTDEPAPVGGINGPARVDPDTGEADNGGQDD